MTICTLRQDQSMNENVREEIDEATATLLEDARRLARFRSTGEGVPWAEVEAWMQSWSSEHELPPPQPRVL
jgi:predicted transcriptional regulator